MVLKPGTHLANSNVTAPWRVTRPCVFSTHVAASSENRQSTFSTRAPYRRPSRYQAESEMMQASTISGSAYAMCSFCAALMVPAASITGTLGTGIPPCSISTQKNNSKYA